MNDTSKVGIIHEQGEFNDLKPLRDSDLSIYEETMKDDKKDNK